MQLLSSAVYLVMLAAQLLCVTVAASDQKFTSSIRALASACGFAFAIYMILSLHSAEVAAGWVVAEPPQ